MEKLSFPSVSDCISTKTALYLMWGIALLYRYLGISLVFNKNCLILAKYLPVIGDLSQLICLLFINNFK